MPLNDRLFMLFMGLKEIPTVPIFSPVCMETLIFFFGNVLLRHSIDLHLRSQVAVGLGTALSATFIIFPTCQKSNSRHAANRDRPKKNSRPTANRDCVRGESICSRAISISGRTVTISGRAVSISGKSEK